LLFGVDPRRGDEGGQPVAGVEKDLPAVVVDGAVVSRRGEFHPPALLEPCVTVSRHTAPVVEPLGSAPWRQWTNMPG
jgi:hypothetical protein